MNINVYLILAILLLIKVIDKILAKLLYFKALDVGLFPVGSLENLLQNNDFGFLLGFWNVLWWILFIACLIGWVLTLFLINYILNK